MDQAPSLPCPPVDARSLPGQSVDLERLDPERHGRALWHAVGVDPTLWTGTPSGPFADEAAFAAWLRDRAQRPDVALYAIIDKRGQQPSAAGIFFLLHIDEAMGTLELGLIYGPALSRRIGGTEAFFLIGRYIFETLGYRRLAWLCNVANAASNRAAVRFGFTLEGVLRQNAWIKGANWDMAAYSLLDREWPAMGARLAAWLSPANFTADGHQIKTLDELGGTQPAVRSR